MFYRVLGEPYTAKGSPRSLAIWGLGGPHTLAIRAQGAPYHGGGHIALTPVSQDVASSQTVTPGELPS